MGKCWHSVFDDRVGRCWRHDLYRQPIQVYSVCVQVNKLGEAIAVSRADVAAVADQRVYMPRSHRSLTMSGW